MRARMLAGAAGLGCAGLMVLVLAIPATAERSGAGRTAAGDVAAACERAGMETPRGGPTLELTTDVPDGATVAPGQEIGIRLTWDPKVWSGEELDLVMACVRVKGALDPNLSAAERPAANDGEFEYLLRVPENIRPDCDICVEGFLAGITADDCCPQQIGSDRRCFMSGPPAPPAKPTPPAAPAPAAPPAPPISSTPAVEVPPEVPAAVAGISTTRPAPTPDPAPALVPPIAAPVAELPRTGPTATQIGTAGGGLTLALGGLAVIGGAGRRTRRRIGA